MISAIGYSKNTFTPYRPQKLGRGKEYWLEEIYPEEELKAAELLEQGQADDLQLERMIFSGAALEEISAKHTSRSLASSGVSIGELLFALFSEQTIVVWGEDCVAVPEGASGVESYRISETTGSFLSWRHRWELRCSSPEMLDAAIAMGAEAILIGPKEEEEGAIRGELPPDYEEAPSILSEAIRQALYMLGNGRALKSHYRAFVLPRVLKHTEHVALLHRDRNGPALGIYSLDQIEVEPALTNYAAEHSLLLVPFAIPPMIARWDRALIELHRAWDKEEPFPLDVGTAGQKEIRAKGRDKKEEQPPQIEEAVPEEVKEQPKEEPEAHPSAVEEMPVEVVEQEPTEPAIEDKKEEDKKEEDKKEDSVLEPEKDDFAEDYEFEEDSW